MIKKQKVLAVIPARGGSKGIKNKNVVSLCGKPLLAYTLGAACGSRYIDKTVVSTDSHRIAEVARNYGGEVPFFRPKKLAGDESKSVDAIIHAINFFKNQNESYDLLVLLQPTAPLRRSDDIDRALEIFIENGEKPLASVSEVEDHPILVRRIDDKGELVTLLGTGSTVRRQDMPAFYRVNGCIYINRIEEIGKNTSFNDNKIPYIMPRERSVDIDEMKDFLVAEYYMSKGVE